MGTSAKVLAAGDVRRFQARVGRGRFALRNRVLVMLSFNAGLRACEMAGLDWRMVVGADGKVGTCMMIHDAIAKNGRGRRLPTHAKLKSGLIRLHASLGRPKQGAVIVSQRGGHMTPRSVVNWFKGHYDELGLQGCSSHSGRRTFITRSARLVSKAGGSLRDVQELAGHRAITTTERYIEGDRDAQRRLVRML
jgi:integrase/recombinase XerC